MKNRVGMRGEIDAPLWDSDLFDAEILVERMGLAKFTKEDLAKALGVQVKSLRAMYSRGSILAPDHYEKLPVASRIAIWTPRQVAFIIANRRSGPPCGTAAAASRHFRRGEPLDNACRLARNAADTARARARRERADLLVSA